MIWSPQQQSIFNWFAAPRRHLVVRARAGTGKSTTIVEGLRHIAFAPGERALVCAFNKRIQLELEARVGRDNADVDVKTLHSLGFMFLKGSWGMLSLDSDVEDERVRAVIGPDPNWEVVVAIKKLVSIAKGVAPMGDVDLIADLAVAYSCQVDEWHNFSPLRLAQAARKAMDLARTCDAAGRITFDDMLFVPVAEKMIIPLYDWIVVDEAQDMNQAQLMIAIGACKPDGHIVVVGDDRQAIYGFRGADSVAIDRLKAELQAEELGLTTTYRCPASVVREANKLVPDLAAAPGAPEGCVERMSGGELLDVAQPGDVILSRVNAPLVPICLGLIRRGLPARIEGRDVGKMLAQRAKKLKGKSVEDFLAKLGKWAKKARMRAIAYGRCVDQRVQEVTDIEETLHAMTDGCNTVDQILARCESMFGDLENSKQQMVVLSSVHKAKGLEWSRVFLLADTLFCYGKRHSIEESNIAYVAITRAKETLLLVTDKDEEVAIVMPAAEGAA